MNHRAFTGAILALGLCSISPAIAQESSETVIRSVSLADAKSIVEDAGGRVDSVEDWEHNGFVIEATLPGGMPIEFKGFECVGASKACPEYEFTIGFEAKTEEAARDFDRERQVEYVADGVDGSTYLIWRMGFLYGGVTKTYVLNELLETADIGWGIAQIFPYKDEHDRPKGPKPKDAGKLNP